MGRLQPIRGFGFVVPERRACEMQDIYIAAANPPMQCRRSRLVRIERQSERGPKEHCRILERAHGTIVGASRLIRRRRSLVPFDRRGQPSADRRPVVVGGTGRHGGRRNHPLADPTRGAVGHVVEVLANINEPGVDTQIIIRNTHP